MQYNVFGYLLAQRNIDVVFSKLGQLVRSGGVVAFDTVNPFCVTYANRLISIPRLLFRIVRIGALGRSALVRYRAPRVTDSWAEFIVLPRRKVLKHASRQGFTGSSRWILYGDCGIGTIPGTLNSQLLFVLRRD